MTEKRNSCTFDRQLMPDLSPGDRVVITVLSGHAEEDEEPVTAELTLRVKRLKDEFVFFDDRATTFMAWQSGIDDERLYYHSDPTVMEVTSVVKIK